MCNHEESTIVYEILMGAGAQIMGSHGHGHVPVSRGLPARPHAPQRNASQPDPAIHAMQVINIHCQHSFSAKNRLAFSTIDHS